MHEWLDGFRWMKRGWCYGIVQWWLEGKDSVPSILFTGREEYDGNVVSLFDDSPTVNVRKSGGDSTRLM
jgi:hypothetical protein